MLGTLRRALVPPARPNPLVILWRWRYEVGLLVGTPVAVTGLVDGAGTAVALVTVSGAASLVAAWPRLRGWVVARAWCVVTPHRVRALCVQRQLFTRRGRLPAVLWCSPTSYGELVVVWCPAGLEALDFDAERTGLAAACFAREVVVRSHSRHRNVVYLAVVRRGGD